MVIGQIKDNSTFVSKRSNKYLSQKERHDTQSRRSDWLPATFMGLTSTLPVIVSGRPPSGRGNWDYCGINQSETSMRLVPFLVLESLSWTSFRFENRFNDKKWHQTM